MGKRSVMIALCKEQIGTSPMPERPRLLILDVLESYVRDRNIDVYLERREASSAVVLR